VRRRRRARAAPRRPAASWSSWPAWGQAGDVRGSSVIGAYGPVDRYLRQVGAVEPVLPRIIPGRHAGQTWPRVPTSRAWPGVMSAASPVDPRALRGDGRGIIEDRTDHNLATGLYRERRRHVRDIYNEARSVRNDAGPRDHRSNQTPSDIGFAAHGVNRARTGRIDCIRSWALRTVRRGERVWFIRVMWGYG